MAAITRWDPFRDLVTVQDEINRLFGRTYGTREGNGGLAGWAPAIDIHETGESFVIDAELPGIDPDAVDINVEGDTLTLRGERSSMEESEGDTYHRVERRFGAFARSVVLPTTADTERIEATFDKGVLTITVPKAERAKPRRIEVKARA
jgi:HSP20 family protein